MWNTFKNLFTRSANTLTTVVNTVDDSAAGVGYTTL